MPEMTNKPPESPAATHCWLPNSRRSPSLARRQLREFLAGVDGGSRFAEVGELLLSELVTNAWQHGTSPGQLIWAGFEVDRDQLFIAVEDASGTKPVLKDVTDRQECGRGLLLVEQLAHEWGCGPRNGIGKRVWAVIGPRTDEQEPSS